MEPKSQATYVWPNIFVHVYIETGSIYTTHRNGPRIALWCSQDAVWDQDWFELTDSGENYAVSQDKMNVRGWQEREVVEISIDQIDDSIQYVSICSSSSSWPMIAVDLPSTCSNLPCNDTKTSCSSILTKPSTWTKHLALVFFDTNIQIEALVLINPLYRKGRV